MNYLLINYSDKIEDNEYFYNRAKNFWKKTKNSKELSPIEEYLITDKQTEWPILSLDEQGKPIKMGNIQFIPVPL